MLLVTPGRLRNAKFKILKRIAGVGRPRPREQCIEDEDDRKNLRKRKEVAAFAVEWSFFDACAFPPFARVGMWGDQSIA